MGKTVLSILLLFSVGSWGVMIVVGQRFGRSGQASKRFMGAFRRAKRLADVQAATAASAPSSLVGLFKAGYAEIEAQIAHAQGGAKIQSLDSLAEIQGELGELAAGCGYAEEALRLFQQRATRIESARLSKYVPFLATTAAATPFIGLFGTVWGIIESFASIAASNSNSITAVAPGISEALINTAAGLFAAVPALLAYNYFVQRLRLARGEMEDFTLEFLNLTERNFM